MALQATIFYSGIFGLFFLYLSTTVTKLRIRYQVWFGDGGHLPLLTAIRIHSNFAEYVTFILFLLFLSELLGARPWMLHLSGVVLLVGRILHIFALKNIQGPSIFRLLGTVLTWVVLLMLSLYCLIAAI